jgi:hypothetical protein
LDATFAIGFRADLTCSAIAIDADEVWFLPAKAMDALLWITGLIASGVFPTHKERFGVQFGTPTYMDTTCVFFVCGAYRLIFRTILHTKSIYRVRLDTEQSARTALFWGGKFGDRATLKQSAYALLFMS